jgi:cytochrome P450
MGWGDVVVVADPELIREVVTGPTDVFRAGEANPRMAQLLGSNSLMALDGQSHLSARQRIKPALHGRALRHHEAIVEQLVRERVRAWPLGAAVPAYRESRELMGEVILRTVLGPHNSPQTLDELREIVKRVVDVTLVISPSYQYRWLEAVPPWKGYWRAVARMRELVDEIIDQRDSNGESGGSLDMLSMLISASGGDRQWLREQLMTLILAGQETMPATLAWSVELLACDPRARSLARERGSTYLEAVIFETLRLTSVPGAARMLAAPVTVGSYDLPAGTIVLPLAFLVSHDPRLYHDPDDFLPERWENTRPGTYTWLPFGGGPRRCIGAAFSQMVLSRSLKTMLEHIDWRPTGRRPERYKTAHVSLIPANGAPIERTA